MTVDALGLTTLSGIEKFHRLRRLSAYGNTLTDLAPLAELFSVEELQLGYNNLCALSALTGHTALRRVILDHNALRDITALSGCTALEELDLSYNDLNSLAALRSLTQLRTLNITGNPALTADMVRSLQEALPACQIITDIDLSHAGSRRPNRPRKHRSPDRIGLKSTKTAHTMCITYIEGRFFLCIKTTGCGHGKQRCSRRCA